MDELKPEDGQQRDISDRRSGRSRGNDMHDNEPHINVDDIDLDLDDRRMSAPRHERDEDGDDDDMADEGMAADPRPASRNRRKSVKQAPSATRQYLMMGTGILVLLLLILGIGSALKSPSAGATDDSASSAGVERNIDLSGASEQNDNTDNAAAGTPSSGTAMASQNLSAPPISPTPTEAPPVVTPEGQHRVEISDDLTHSLTQQQGQIDQATGQSTLPTAPATVSATAGNASGAAAGMVSRPERKHTVIEPVQKAVSRPQMTARNAYPTPSQTVTTSARTVTRHTEPVHTAPATVKAPTAAASTVHRQSSVSAPVASQAVSRPAVATGSGTSIKSAPSSSYTLQLSSSSSEANLNAWAKKEKVPDYLVYQTVRNGKPWYVLVSGVYSSKAEAEKAISGLPGAVRDNKPWTKPIHQVKSELK